MKKNLIGLLILFLMFWANSQFLFSEGIHENEKTNILANNTVQKIAPNKTRILVGPNILVSRDGDIPHVELMIATNPNDPKNLFGAAITFTRPDGSMACKTYTSLDGGYTWLDSAFPEQIKFGGGDPVVAFGLNDTAYFATLAFIKDDKGRARAGLYVYRSEDKGITWQKPEYLGYSYDHEKIVVDQTYGKYAGRIYLGALYGPYPEYTVGVFRSDDDGRSFVGPVECARGGGKIGINVDTMLILSDGTLFVPYRDFEIDPEKRKTSKTTTFWFVTSSDGGVTFSAATKIAYEQLKGHTKEIEDLRQGNFDGGPFPAYAVDNQSKEYGDRLYAAWNDYRFGNCRIMFSYSSNRGKTWSEPKLVNPDIPDWASQYQPMLFVNNQGILGIMWFDTRCSKQMDQYHLYFSVSVNGGKSFVPPVQVSSEPSFPARKVNLIPVPFFNDLIEESIKVSTLSAFSRWGNGGDYMGLTADSQGVFHPFWADSRNGTFQIWTCPIVVKTIDEENKSKEKSSIRKEKKIITKNIKLVYDPVKYKPETNVVVLPIRLKNVSHEPLFGPVSLKINKLVNPNDVKWYGKEAVDIPQILNADNGIRGVGAVFDYSSALRDFGSLEPGAISEAVKLEFKFSRPRQTNLYLEVEILGFVLVKE